MSDKIETKKGRTMSLHALHRVAGGYRDEATQGEELAALHRRSFRGKDWLSASQTCGCFYCLRAFDFEQINNWVDDDQTALCPYCGIDSVIGFDTACVDRDLLDAMNKRWFKTIGLTADQWKEAVATDKWLSR